LTLAGICAGFWIKIRGYSKLTVEKDSILD
jgi:hypothetical protein